MLTTERKTLSSKKENFYSLLLEELALNFYKVDVKHLGKLKSVCEDYFKCALILDNLIDNPLNKHDLIEGIFSFTKNYRSTIKTLQSIYPEESLFWNQFISNEQDHFHFLIKEQEMTGNSEIDELTYYDLTCGKSAILCSNVVSSLAALSANPSKADNSLLEFIRKIHIAFQLQDDVDDFDKDMAKGQLSLAVNTVKQQLTESIGSIPNPDFAKKFFFTSGIAQQLLSKAIDEYDQCIQLIQDYDTPKLMAFCRRQRELISAQIYEIEAVINKARAKAKQSNVYIDTQVHIESQI